MINPVGSTGLIVQSVRLDYIEDRCENKEEVDNPVGSIG